jgi:hypothetical protein
VAFVAAKRQNMAAQGNALGSRFAKFLRAPKGRYSFDVLTISSVAGAAGQSQEIGTVLVSPLQGSLSTVGHQTQGVALGFLVLPLRGGCGFGGQLCAD